MNKATLLWIKNNIPPQASAKIDGVRKRWYSNENISHLYIFSCSKLRIVE